MKGLKKIAFLIILICLLTEGKWSIAQQIKANAELDTNSIIIGQQIKLKLSVDYRVDAGKRIQIKWPQINDTIIKQIEVINQSKIDTLIPDKSDPYHFVQTKTLDITSFDSGYWAMPPFTFTITDDSTSIQTEALLLEVNTVAVDTTEAIKPIKPPYEEKYTWIDWIKDNLLIISIVVGAAILLILIIYFTKKYYKEKPRPVAPAPPPIPAHIIALEKIEKLKTEMLWQNGKLKAYHSALTEIIREYIENRFKVPALEQTTEEILYSFRSVAVDNESLNKLKQMLVLADLVKFAKEHPLPNENELSMNNAIDFINGTKKEEIINPTEEQKNV